MANIENDYVLVNEEVNGAGLETFWALRSDLNLERLKEAWKKANLSDELIIEEPSLEVAFTRAMKTLEGDDLYLESVSTGETALMLKNEVDGLPQPVCIGKWRLGKTGNVELTYSLDPSCADIHRGVVAEFETAQKTITATDVSKWLKELVEGPLRGLTLREKGGVYYVPPMYVATWRSIKAAVSEASATKVYIIPMLKCADAVETIVDAALAESESVIDKLTKELEAHADGSATKGPDALKTREQQAAELKARMAQYEAFLGVKLPQVQERLESLKAGLFQAGAAAAAAKASRK